jgi:hypothetical protein
MIGRTPRGLGDRVVKLLPSLNQTRSRRVGPNVSSGLSAHHDGNALGRGDWVRGRPRWLMGDRARIPRSRSLARVRDLSSNAKPAALFVQRFEHCAELLTFIRVWIDFRQPIHDAYVVEPHLLFEVI